MHAPKVFTRIVHGFRYSVETATLLAHDSFWDGHNFERNGTNSFLYRAKNGAYFLVELTQWQGSSDSLTPISIDQAIAMYTGIENDPTCYLCIHEVEYEIAFPDATILDA